MSGLDNEFFGKIVTAGALIRPPVDNNVIWTTRGRPIAIGFDRVSSVTAPKERAAGEIGKDIGWGNVGIIHWPIDVTRRARISPLGWCWVGIAILGYAKEQTAPFPVTKLVAGTGLGGLADQWLGTAHPGVVSAALQFVL